MLQPIESWLKESVFGIIVLGAIGSILAVYLLKQWEHFQVTWLPRLYEITGRFVHWWLGRPLEESLRFKIAQRPYEVVAYFSFEIGKVLFLPWIALLAYVGSVQAIRENVDGAFPVTAFFCAAVLFLSVYETCRSMARLWYHRAFTVKGGLLDQTLDALERKGGDES